MGFIKFGNMAKKIYRLTAEIEGSVLIIDILTGNVERTSVRHKLYVTVIAD